MHRLDRDLLILHECDPQIAGSGIASVGAIAREIATGNHPQAGFAPKPRRHGLVATLRRYIQPQEETAGRTAIAIAIADDLVGKIEFHSIELTVCFHVLLIAISRDRDLLR